MKSCSVHLWVLSFLVLVPVSHLQLSTRTAKLHQNVTLPCKQECSGVVKWTMISKPGQVVAQCDKTSCQSKKEGFKISRDQYLDGDLDLEISSVDYSHRTVFLCQCDGEIVCNVRLYIEDVTSTVQKNPGEVLMMDFPKLDLVEVEFRSKNTTRLYGDQICAEIYDLLRCESDYTNRTSFSNSNRTLALRDLEVSDSGVYIVRDMKNEQIIHTYVVSVEDPNQQPPEDPVSTGTIVAAVLIPLLVLFGLLLGFIYKRWRKEKKVQEKLEREKEELERENMSLKMEKEKEQRLQKLNRDMKVSWLLHQMLKVDVIIEMCSYKEGAAYQSLGSLIDIRLNDMLEDTKTKIEEFMKTWTGDGPEKNDLVLWYHEKKEDLEKIIKMLSREKEKEKLKDPPGGTATEQDRNVQVGGSEEEQPEDPRNVDNNKTTNQSWTDLFSLQRRRNVRAEPEELGNLGMENKPLKDRAKSEQVVFEVKISQLMKMMAMMKKADDLIMECGTKRERRFQKWTSSRYTTVEEQLRKTKAEIKAFIKTWNEDESQKNELKWWCEEKIRELEELTLKNTTGGTEMGQFIVDPTNADEDITRRTQSCTESSTNQQCRIEGAESERVSLLCETL